MTAAAVAPSTMTGHPTPPDPGDNGRTSGKED